MGRRRAFTREFKLERLRLIRDRGVSAAQASRDLGVQPTCCAIGSGFRGRPEAGLPRSSQMKPEQLEIERLRRE